MRRIASLMAGIVFLAGLGFVVGPAQAQKKKPPFFQPPPPVTGINPATQYSGIKLMEKSELRQIVNVAQESIRDAIINMKKNNLDQANRDWKEAAEAIQTVLNEKEDSYVQVRQRDAHGQETVRWTSVKYEANNLLASMPKEGLDVYDFKYGAKAKQLLEDAKSGGDFDKLAECANRYQFTQAGAEATELLATHFLDRGQFFLAALRFERLLGMNPERLKIDDLTLYKAALAYKRSNNAKSADEVWKKLETKLAGKNLKVGDTSIPLARLQNMLDEIPQLVLAKSFDWPLIRGNWTNSAQAVGSQPLLDMVLWQRPLYLDKSDPPLNELEHCGAETRDRITNAINTLSAQPQTPVLPGFFPIAANNLVVYRSHMDIRAVHLTDGKDHKAGEIAWKSTEFDGSLSIILHKDSKVRSTVESWLTQYFQPPHNQTFPVLLYENSLLGTLATDHRLVYAVDDLAVPAPSNILNQPFMWNGPGVVQDIKPLVLGNSLHAYDLVTGKFKWRLGILDPTKRDPNDPFNDSHFLGVPMSVGGKLYVLNEKNNGAQGDADLRLVVIDPATGNVLGPPQPLGTVQQTNRITHDPSRRINAVHLAYGEGILVCPTNAGEVLGVDLLSRTLAWAYPYREKYYGSQPGRPGFNPNQLILHQNWHSAPPVISDGKAVFTAPDADSIHCVNLRDGTKVWSKPRAEGSDLFLGGVYNGKVVIVAKNAVRILSLADGSQLAYLTTGDLPSGQGIASKNVYYLPLKKGELFAIDLEGLAFKASNRQLKSGAIPPGNLVFYEGSVLSQTPREIVAYPQLTAQLELASKAVEKDPNDAEKRFQRGVYRLADGQVHGAVEDLEHTLHLKPEGELLTKAKKQYYEALSDLFLIDFNNSADKYLKKYEAMCLVPDNPPEQQSRQARFYRLVGQGREGQGNLVEAFQMYKEFGALPINQSGIANIDDPTRKIPTTVWLRGRINSMMAKAKPEQKEPLEAKIAQEWKLVESKNDVDAIRSFVGMFDVPFAVGREARLKLAEAIMARNQDAAYLEAELNLHQLLSDEYRSDAKVGGRALAGLIYLEEKKGKLDNLKLAAAYSREIAQRFPKDVLWNGKTGLDLRNKIAEDPRYLPELEESGPLWSKVKIAGKDQGPGQYAGGLQGFIFHPEGDLTPAMRNLRLVLDPATANAPKLRLVDFSNNTMRWPTPIVLTVPNFPNFQNPTYQFFTHLYQQGNPNAIHNPNARFRFFQVKGHLGVIQVGITAYCLDLNKGQVLWQHDLVAGNQFPPFVVPQLVTVDTDGNLEMRLVNQQTGQQTVTRIGSVGAVQASYVALVTQKGLVVLDPLRGTEMWSKMDVPAKARVFGDSQHLYLLENYDAGAAGAGRCLRANDGATVEVPDFGHIYQNRLHVRGRKILAAATTKEGVTLRLADVHTGKDLWSKTFDSAAVVLKTEDPGLAGVIEDGKLIVLDGNTGQELVKTPVIQKIEGAELRVAAEELKNLREPLLLADAERFYLALNQPVDAAGQGIVSSNFSNGLRCRLVNGWFLAYHKKDAQFKVGERVVERKKGDLAWHSLDKLANQMILLEQFDTMPVIMFSARYFKSINPGNPGAGGAWVYNTQSMGKQWGKLVYDSGPRNFNGNAQFYAYNIDLKAGTINMIGFNGAIQHYIDDGRKLPDNRGGALPKAEPDVFAANGVYRVDSLLNNQDGRYRNKISKVHSLKLTAGRGYTIHLASNQFDAYLFLENEGGALLAQDDDGGGGLNSQIVFRPQQTGLYRIIATSLDGNSTGNFTLTVRQDNALPLPPIGLIPRPNLRGPGGLQVILPPGPPLPPPAKDK